MKLYQEILIKAQERKMLDEAFPKWRQDAKEIVSMECYRALARIKEILEDERLEDEECFMKIEEIVCVLEDIGSDAGLRHDFG